jgi:hypothetical protein
MADADEPEPPAFYTPGLKRPAPKPEPGELLFTFRAPDHRQVDCELRTHGEYGVEAQFFFDREFSRSRRFETRAMAVRWAEAERAALERGIAD